MFRPFFVDDAPRIELGGDIAQGASGQPCGVERVVRGPDGQPSGPQPSGPQPFRGTRSATPKLDVKRRHQITTLS